MCPNFWLVLYVRDSYGGYIVPTQSRSVLEVGVVLDKVLGLVGGEQAGLDEADQGVDLQEVVLDRSPSEQNPETGRELEEQAEWLGWKEADSEEKEEDDETEEDDEGGGGGWWRRRSAVVPRSGSCGARNPGFSVGEPRPQPEPSISNWRPRDER